MSKLHSQFAFENNEARFESESPILIETQPLSVGNAHPDLQPARQVMKVKGSITVSF